MNSFKPIFLFFAVFAWFINFAQLEKQHWHFNITNRGMFFNPLTAYTPSLTTTSYTPYGGEGCFVMTDPNSGDLQFYTDGIRVVDKGHNQMVNGGGLLGHASNCSNGKSCLVPGTCNQYYVFSGSYATEAGTGGSLYYSLVDMSLVGNGTVGNEYGAVVAGQKNIFIATNISEAVEIIPQKNSHNYWMLVGKNSTSQILIYEITSSGINLNSTYNLPYTISDMRSFIHCPANDKISLLSLIELDPCLILDFDRATGTITSTFQIPGTPFGPSPLYWMGTAHAEWSPDGTKLYVAKYRTSTPSSGGKLFQYDLNLPANPPVLVFNLGTNSNLVSQGLRLGPDNKVYFLYTKSVGVVRYLCSINNPNLPFPACNFQQDVFDFGVNMNGSSGLPLFFKWENTIVQINDTLLSYTCQIPPVLTFNPLINAVDGENDNLSFSVNSVTGGTYNIVGNQIEFTLNPGFVGSPQLEIIYGDDYCFPLTDTFFVTIATAPGIGTLNLVDTIHTCDAFPITLDAGPGFASYLWSTGEVSQTINALTTGMYSVDAIDGICIYKDSTYIQFNLPTPINLGPNINQCADSIMLSVGAFTGNVIWSDGSTGNTNWVSGSQQYSVIAENVNGCLSYDTIDVSLNPLPQIDLGPNQNICSYDQFFLEALNFTTVLWSDGSTNDSLEIMNTGMYYVDVTNVFSCQASDTILLTINVPAQINVGPDISICATQSLLSSNGFIGSVAWSNGVVAPQNLATVSGNYSAIATDINGCLSYDTMNLFLAPIPTINLGNDALACAGELNLDASGYTSVLWSDGSSGDFLNVLVSGNYAVEVVNSFGCIGADNINIEIVNPQEVSLGPDMETCSLNELTIFTGVDYGTYLWSTGETSSQITVDETGLYWVDQSLCGDIIRDSINIIISTLDQVVYVPNAFTPDGNSRNNQFEIVFGDYSHILKYELFIYNRWGSLIYYTTDPYAKWSGNYTQGLVLSGTYVYVIKCETDCDEFQFWTKEGHVTVLK